MNDPGQALLQVASEQGFLGQRDEENIRKGKLREPFWRMCSILSPPNATARSNSAGTASTNITQPSLPIL
jgi:hypothetical protein